MESKISATEAARRFSDLVNRVHYRGEEFLIERGGVAVCRVVPVRSAPGTLAALVAFLAEVPRRDDGFADDLEDVVRSVPIQVPESSWPS